MPKGKITPKKCPLALDFNYYSAQIAIDELSGNFDFASKNYFYRSIVCKALANKYLNNNNIKLAIIYVDKALRDMNLAIEYCDGIANKKYFRQIESLHKFKSELPTPLEIDLLVEGDSDLKSASGLSLPLDDSSGVFVGNDDLKCLSISSIGPVSICAVVKPTSSESCENTDNEPSDNSSIDADCSKKRKIDYDNSEVSDSDISSLDDGDLSFENRDNKIRPKRINSLGLFIPATNTFSDGVNKNKVSITF